MTLNPEDRKTDDSKLEPEETPPLHPRRDMTPVYQAMMYDMFPGEWISMEDFLARAKQRREELKSNPQSSLIKQSPPAAPGKE